MMEVEKTMPRPHEIYYERPPHEEILEKLDRIEEILKRIYKNPKTLK